MSKTLVIVESPAKAKTIAGFLDRDHRVVATMGHLRDLPANRLGVDVEKDFEPEYLLGSGKEKVVGEIRDAAAEAEHIVLATDADREGEAIAWHVVETLRLPKKKISRVTFPEITRDAVREAMKHPGKIDQHLVNAQEARRILDRLVGYRLSPLLWEQVEKGLAVGRVQSAAVRLVLDRAKEIAAFEPAVQWEVIAEGETEEPPRFTMRLLTDEEFPTEDAAKAAIMKIGKCALTVSDVRQEFVEHHAPPPFITASLLEEAAERARFTPKKTVMIAQRLYEGIEVGKEGLVGLITYPRTDEEHVAAEAAEAARAIIEKTWGEELLPEKAPKPVRRRKGRAAHEAIRPARLDLEPDALKKILSRDQLTLYRLIWDRFLASQMAPAMIVETFIEMESDAGQRFEATCAWIDAPGFLESWPIEHEHLIEIHPTSEDLPSFEVGQSAKIVSLSAKREEDAPPEPHTPASLIAQMEALGIGRPSTYASILAAIQERGCVTVEKGALKPTDRGQKMTDYLTVHFPDLVNLQRTALLEEQLDQVANGKANAADLLRGFHTTLSQRLKAAQQAASSGRGDSRPAGIDCDRCGAPMLIKWGRNGRFLGCSNYPACRSTMEYEGPEEDDLDLPQMQHRPAPHQKCPTCGRPMIIKSGRRGRFAACSGYPDCKTTEPLRIGVRCPVDGCEGHLVERQSKKGRLFWACDAYPDCDYTIWDRPVDRPCPECGHVFIVIGRGTLRGREKCPECGWKAPPPQLQKAEVESTTES